MLYTDSFNRRVLLKAFDDADIAYFPLFDAQVHVFVGEHHPLAQEKLLQPEDLEEYPRYSFEQGTENSFYYSEEPLSYLPHKRNVRISGPGNAHQLAHQPQRLHAFHWRAVGGNAFGALRPSRWTWTRPCRWATSCTTSAAPAPCLLRYIKELQAGISANPTVQACRQG